MSGFAGTHGRGFRVDASWEATMKSAIVSVIALASAALLSPAHADTYVFTNTIAVPPTASNTTGLFTRFDISFFDPLTQLDYVANRSNAAVDVFSATNDTFVQHVLGDPQFAGQQASNDTSGPDGVQVVNVPGQHQVWAGDGPSTVYNFNISNQTTNPTITQNGMPLNTGGTARADEMAYSPTANTILVANNADNPAFATLINAKTGVPIVVGPGNNTKITIPGGNSATMTGGLEASDFNPVTKSFFLAVPQLAGIPGAKGGVAEIDPVTGAVKNVFNLQSTPGACGNCSPTGLAAAANGQMLVGDGNTGPGTGAMIIDPTGKVLVTFSGIQGVDQVWYDPTTNRWFLAASNNPASNGGPILAIIDAATDTIFQIINTTAGDHSVAVDPISGKIFVPFASGNTVCPNGCIAVFSDVATAIPEPSTWAMMLIGFLGLGVAFRQSRRKVSFA
jgi:hypothetical protein